jgi:hypothetical protein
MRIQGSQHMSCLHAGQRAALLAGGVAAVSAAGTAADTSLGMHIRIPALACLLTRSNRRTDASRSALRVCTMQLLHVFTLFFGSPHSDGSCCCCCCCSCSHPLLLSLLLSSAGGSVLFGCSMLLLLLLSAGGAPSSIACKLDMLRAARLLQGSASCWVALIHSILLCSYTVRLLVCLLLLVPAVKKPNGSNPHVQCCACFYCGSLVGPIRC